MQFWIQLETSLGAIARVKGFQEETPSEDKEAESTIRSEGRPGGAIEFKNVSASYRYSEYISESLYIVLRLSRRESSRVAK